MLPLWRLDPLIIQAGEEYGISTDFLKTSFPHVYVMDKSKRSELQIWRIW
jgi:hypothetical protein